MPYDRAKLIDALHTLSANVEVMACDLSCLAVYDHSGLLDEIRCALRAIKKAKIKEVENARIEE